METARICPGCGKTLAADAPQGVCPECLLKAGLGTETGNPGATARLRFIPPSREELARHFPQLEILEFIGQGGMGAVYKARQPALDRVVALKILPPQTANDPGFAERFSREARALAQLDHPNIVTVHDFGRAGDYHYFVMEFVNGVTLRQLEQAKKVTPREALAIIPQICEALQLAHDEGIIHRDIKPENILVDKRGRVKIADFGLAKLLGQEKAGEHFTEAGHVMGTPHYMAPEQIEKPREVDHRADIYSLGVVFYEMLTGELPLGRFAPPSHKAETDVRLDEVVLKALEKEPGRRYQQASQVRQEVETIATPFAGTPANRLPEAAPGKPRAYVALCLAGLSGILGIVTFFQWPDPPAVLVLSILAAALAGMVLGIRSRQFPAGKQAVAVGGLNLAIWLTIAGLILPKLIPTRAVENSPGVPEANSKRQRFEPREGMASGTAWTVFDPPSSFNQTGWAMMAQMALGGEAPVRLPGQVAEVCRVILLEGNDSQITVAIREPDRPDTVTVTLRRDQPAEFTIAGRGYRILYPSVEVTLDQPETSPLAQIILTPVVRGPGAGSDLVSRKPSSSQGTFGPVIERRLSQNTQQNVCFIDLDRDKVFAPSRPDLTSAELDSWVTRNGIDALAVTKVREAGDLQGLVGWNMRLVQVGAENWNKLTSSELAAQLESVQRMREVILRGENALPATFLFQTEEGNQGVLQITGFTDNPRAVNFRYKLAKRSTGAAEGSSTTTLLKRLINLELRRAVAVSTRESLDPERIQIEDELARFEQDHPGLRAGDSRSLLAERRAELVEEKTRLAGIYIPSHPRIAEVQTQIDAVDTMLGDRVIPSGEPRMSFGPAIERVINDADYKQGNEVLDLDTGETLSPSFEPRREDWTKEELFGWIGRRKVDLMAGRRGRRTEGEQWGVGTATTNELKLVLLANDAWDQLSAPALSAKLAVDPEGVLAKVPKRNEPAKVYFLPVLPAFPVTFGFETRQGSIGLLQVTGFSDDHHGLELRFKKVQGGTSGRSRDEDKTFSFTHPAKLGTEVLDAARSFALEHQWKLKNEEGLADGVVIKAEDLRGKKIAFEEAEQERDRARLIVSVEPGAEFSARRIGVAIARRLGLAAGFPETRLGPEIERVIEIRETGTTNWFLDLDTGSLLMPPSHITELLTGSRESPSNLLPRPRAEQYAAWVAQTGADILVFETNGVELIGGILAGIVGDDPVRRYNWDDLTAEDVLEVVCMAKPQDAALNWGLGGRSWHVRSDPGMRPAYRYFKTRNGGIGILQITGFTDNPRGVRIRYRLVLDGTQAAAALFFNPLIERG